MGMDLGIIASRSIGELKEETWPDFYEWDEIKENEKMYDEYGTFVFPERPVQMWYARKFYSLLDGVPELKKSYTDYIIRINKETLKHMINYYAFNPDYFDGFNGLPRLCELYQMYDELQAQGINLYFYNSY